jgi:hypothetical protein
VHTYSYREVFCIYTTSIRFQYFIDKLVAYNNFINSLIDNEDIIYNSSSRSMYHFSLLMIAINDKLVINDYD